MVVANISKVRSSDGNKASVNEVIELDVFRCRRRVVRRWGRREHRQRFWEAIARGLSSEEAGMVAGVSPAVGTRWFRENSGMPSNSLAPLSGRYLSFAEREEIAIRHAQGFGIREIAERIGRCPSTISRKLRRNAATRRGDLRYRATRAQVARRPARRSSKSCEAGCKQQTAPICARPTRRRHHRR